MSHKTEHTWRLCCFFFFFYATDMAWGVCVKQRTQLIQIQVFHRHAHTIWMYNEMVYLKSLRPRCMQMCNVLLRTHSKEQQRLYGKYFTSTTF